MENPDNKFWQNVKKDLARLQEPKHHLELYSMCKSENPYIKYFLSNSRQIKNSPNITTETVAELICRDKACELQYCLSLMKIATENRRRIIEYYSLDLVWKDARNSMIQCGTAYDWNRPVSTSVSRSSRTWSTELSWSSKRSRWWWKRRKLCWRRNHNISEIHCFTYI